MLFARRFSFAGVAGSAGLRLVALAVCLFLASAANSFGQQPSGSPASTIGHKDVFFLIDTTGSMVGLPAGSGSQDILGPVLARVIEHADYDGAEGDRLFVATFRSGLYDLDGDGPRFDKMKSFRMRAELPAARDYVRAIESAVRKDSHLGSTGIHDSLAEIFGVMDSEYRTVRDDRSYRQLLVLFTDGEENVNPARLPEIVERYQLKREESNMGNRVFLKTLVFGTGQCMDLGAGTDCSRGDPKAALRVPLQVTPSHVDLGNMRGTPERSVTLHVDPPDSHLTAVTGVFQPSPDSPFAGLLTAGVESGVLDGSVTVRFSISNVARADALLLENGGNLQLTGALSLRPNDDRLQLHPAELPVSGNYAGTRDVTVNLRFANAAFAERKSGGAAGIARFSSQPQRIGLLQAQFSELAANDSIAVELIPGAGRFPGVRPGVVVGNGQANTTSLQLRKGDQPVSMVIPAASCVPEGRYDYRLVVRPPAGLTLKVITADGQVWPLRDGTATLPLMLVAEGFGRSCEQMSPVVRFVIGLALLALALGGSFCAYLVLNRPPRGRRLESQGLVPHRLRRAQGLTSKALLVGSSPTANLQHTALPAQAFRIRSTRFQGTAFDPLVPGFTYAGRACELRKTTYIASGREIVFTPPQGGASTSIRLIG